MMTILQHLFSLLPAFAGLALIVWIVARWEAKSQQKKLKNKQKKDK